MNRDLLGHAIVENPPRIIEGAEPRETTYYLVASWYAAGRYWKLWPALDSREDAENWIRRSLANVRGHTHAVVIEVRLPGIRKFVEA